MSIRLRFTLLYTIILALTLVLFGASVYAIQAQTTLHRARAVLSNSAQRLADGRRFESMVVRRPPRPSPEPGREPIVIFNREPFRDQEIYFQTRSPSGEILFRSGNLNDQELPLSDAARQAVLAGQPWLETLRITEGRVLVYSLPVHVAADKEEIIQVARSLADLDQVQAALVRNLIGAGAVVLLAAFGIGWFFSGVVLRPITRITQTAQAIGAEQDFGRRVEYRGPKDEIGQLVATFNTMLAQLQAAYSRVEQALQIRRRFVADVSHELRTPLTTIRGNIELLRRTPPISAEDETTVINDIVHETERLIRLVNDLLMLEHSDGNQSLRREPIRLRPFIAGVCQQVGRLDPNRPIVYTEVDDVAVAGDPDALKQVLLILLDNAIAYTSGAVRVSTTLSVDRAAIHIQDEGAGIPPDLLPRLFERFYRGREARAKPGTGLGLSIAKALVEAQKGEIRVESQVGQGSTFSVILPLTSEFPEEALPAGK